jgi:hypothetical protein
MALINRAIPNLYNGVSQQPPNLRLPSQATDQVNGLSSVVFGLSKRPNTTHISKLNSQTLENSYVHTISRDSAEMFKAVFTNGDLFIYDLNGVAQTISFPDGKSYLTASNPRETFACVTVADYTFVVNKNTIVASSATLSTGTSKGAHQLFTDLPTTGNVIGDIWEIAGSGTNNFDNYYVKWDGSGVWRETLKPGLKTSLDAATMPYSLVNNGGGSFTFKKTTWDSRYVGDDLSASFPSFVGKAIADVFFHRNRLGFIAQENVVFSRSGHFFSFFPETVTAVLDTDPVDIAVSHTKVAILRHALAFNTSLMLFADQAQFQLTAKDVLTPKTAVINVTTEFAIEAKAKPTSSGTSIYFGVPKGNHTGVKEYLVQPLTYSNDAADVTAHCPRYIPSGVFKLASSNLDNMILALTLNERNAIYVYKYYWATADQKVQSSWSKFTLDAGAVILDVAFVDTVLYLVVKRSDGTYLEAMDLQDLVENDLGFRVLLDQKTVLNGTYSSVGNYTTWTTPYPVDNTYSLVQAGTFTGGQGGTVLTATAPTVNTLRVTGDFSAHSCYVGKPYVLRYEFSPIYFKDATQISVTHYNIKLKNLELLYDTTGFFSAAVSPDGRDTYTYTNTGKVLGSDSAKIGTSSISTGKFSIPIFGDAVKSKIVLTNASIMPSTFQAAEWSGVLTTKTKHL